MNISHVFRVFVVLVARAPEQIVQVRVQVAGGGRIFVIFLIFVFTRAPGRAARTSITPRALFVSERRGERRRGARRV